MTATTKDAVFTSSVTVAIGTWIGVFVALTINDNNVAIFHIIINLGLIDGLDGDAIFI